MKLSREATANHGVQTLKIEFLYFEGCPGFQETLGILRNIITEEGLEACVVPVTIEPHGSADFSGSPSLFVDGEELFPTERLGQGMSCRIYSTPEGPKNHPTATMMREALAERSPGRRTADQRTFSPRP